jgi:hypothetical protein
VSNDYGQSNSYSKTIKVVEPGPPKLDFRLAKGSKSIGRVPLTARIQNASTGPVASYTWDFGDGATSDDVNPQHTYTRAGTYGITLTVTDVGGHKFESTEHQAIIITTLPPPPPWIWYLLPFVVLGLCNIAVKVLGLGWRRFSFSIDGEAGGHNDLRDKSFGDDQNGFKVCLKRRWVSLSKQYLFENPHGNVKAEDNYGGSLGEGCRLSQGLQVTLNDQVIYFQEFNDSKRSSIAVWMCLIVIFLAVFLTEQHYLNLLWFLPI